MNEFTRTIIRNVLFVFVLFCVGAAFYLFEADPVVIAVAVAATAVVMKVDDYFLQRKKSRRTATV